MSGSPTKDWQDVSGLEQSALIVLSVGVVFWNDAERLDSKQSCAENQLALKGFTMRAITLFIGIGIGIGITPVAAMLAIASGGAGHGHYEYARLLFPYTMLLTRFADDTISPPLILLALAQFPLYGAIIGMCGVRVNTILVVGAVLLIAHMAAALVCFSGVLPNFS